MPVAALPPDDHTHSEWSWDASAGSMVGSCARALELGLPAIAFTEHVDWTRWVLPEPVGDGFPHRHVIDDHGRFAPRPFDAAGFAAALDECRDRFPGLRVRGGVELGEPHRFPTQVRQLLAAGGFQRVLGSLHTIEVAGEPWLVDHVAAAPELAAIPADQVVRTYLREAAAMVAGLPDEVQVLAHVDYPVRTWEGPFDPGAFEEEFREVLVALAGTDRTLEVNTRVPLAAEIVRWWRDVGGRTVSFGSDAHRPATVAARFEVVAAMVESQGFRPDRDPAGFWHR